MKKTILTMLAVALTVTASAQGGKFTVNGTIAGAEGQQVIFSYGTREAFTSDTTKVVDGKFTFSGTLEAPYQRGVLIVGDYDMYGQKENNTTQLAVEPTVITVDAPTGKLDEATIKGGKTQDEMNSLNADVKPLEKELTELNRQYYTAEGEAREAINQKTRPLAERYTALQKQFYQTHPDSYLSPELFAPEVGRLSYEEIKTVFEGFSEEVRNNAPASAEIKKELAALANVQKGATAPDFTTTDIKGNPFTLSSLRGKVVIIDFWASWCVPCRKSNPHMRELYQKYHDRGLEMVYVSDDDGNPDKWKAAVEKDSLTADGFHHVLRGLKRVDGPAMFDKTNDISDKYAIHYLPTKYLIDRQGKIVCKIDEGEDAKLDETLERLLGE